VPSRWHFVLGSKKKKWLVKIVSSLDCRLDFNFVLRIIQAGVDLLGHNIQFFGSDDT
jgi:hypothetical protein